MRVKVPSLIEKSQLKKISFQCNFLKGIFSFFLLSFLFLSWFSLFFLCALSNTVLLCFSSDDHSRVILQPIEDDPSSDYINANYIDVSGNASNATIGSQRNQRNHTPSLVCQASIPLLRLPVIHRAIFYASSHPENTSCIQYMCMSLVSIHVFMCASILSS